ncbi:MAG: type II toxin-antitoxin system Phd/YefM family antitoxin [Actinomycetota bacterium]|nr:MAG: type II toxin-antitoxin system Phd/YefM family antitoxin [Actinomycetota bacterium]
MERRAIMQTIKASEARINFGKVLKRVYRSEERLIVEKGGLAVAAIISIDDLEKLSRLEKLEYFDKFSKAFGSEVERRHINEKQLKKDLEKTKEEVYRELYEKSSK